MPDPRPLSWPRVAFVAAAVLVLAHLGDPWVWAHGGSPGAGERDWGRLFRITGFLPTWMALALALGLEGERSRRAVRWFQTRAARLIIAVAASGALAEIAKLVVRRERPRVSDGAYAFRSLAEEPLRTSALGFPSSHVAVAFGGAFALGWFFPRARWVALMLAAGCAWTRIAAEAHFLSDVAGGALVGYVGARVTMRWLTPPPTDEPSRS